MGLYQASIEGSGTWWHSSAPHSGGREQIWVGIQHIFRWSFNVLNNSHEILNTHLCGHWFFCFWGQLPSMNPHFHLLCLSMRIPSVRLQQRSHYVGLGQPLKNLCPSHSLFSKSHFQHFKTFCSLLLGLKKNLMQICCCFKSPFLSYTQMQMEQHALVLDRTLLSPVPSRKWLSSMYT
jgi:hypothetical protein